MAGMTANKAKIYFCPLQLFSMERIKLGEIILVFCLIKMDRFDEFLSTRLVAVSTRIHTYLQVRRSFGTNILLVATLPSEGVVVAYLGLLCGYLFVSNDSGIRSSLP